VCGGGGGGDGDGAFVGFGVVVAMSLEGARFAHLTYIQTRKPDETKRQ